MQKVKTKAKILGALLGALCLSGLVAAKELTIGVMEPGITAKNVCSLIEKGDKVILNSPGGELGEAYRIAYCIRSTPDVTVEVKKAYSAASFVALASYETCFHPDASIGFHSPYSIREDRSIRPMTIGQLRSYGSWLGRNMSIWGYDTEDIYLVIGMTLSTSWDQMTVMPVENARDLLGDRYIGEC